MNWNRWSAFLCLAGLLIFIPAVFLPAMLVANAVDGPRWYSLWSGIGEFYRSGETFLAALLFCFSLVFPLLKFGLGLFCAAGRRLLPPATRRRIVTLTSWTAKYSMLDVMVIAMLILLVKVHEYVRILPSLGLYLFSAAIILSAFAGTALGRALAAEVRESGGTPDKIRLRAPAWAVLLSLGATVAFHAVHRLREDGPGVVDSVTLTRLTHRGELRRSVEKTLALKDIGAEDHRFFSRDTLKKLTEFGQAVTTDAGWKDLEVWVALDLEDGRTVPSSRIQPVDLEERALTLQFSLPEAVARRDITAVRLVSDISFIKFIHAPIDEEVIRRSDDPFREWTRTWHGRIFSLELRGPPPPGRNLHLAELAVGALLALWSAAALLTPAPATPSSLQNP